MIHDWKDFITGWKETQGDPSRHEELRNALKGRILDRPRTDAGIIRGTDVVETRFYDDGGSDVRIARGGKDASRSVRPQGDSGVLGASSFLHSHSV